MARTLGLGDGGPEVRRLQELLAQRGYRVAVDGAFDLTTQAAVRAFQAQHLDSQGHPLRVDGQVGPLTWWSLSSPRPLLVEPPAIDFTQPPLPELGGSTRGRRALAVAIEELKAATDGGGAVRKYLHGRAPEGTPWGTAFVSWCFEQDPEGPPFPYALSARKLFGELGQRGWVHLLGDSYTPEPGDIVVWSSAPEDGPEGHMGLVHHVAYGMLYTLEGHLDPCVRGFGYELGRMDRLLGYAHVPGP